MIVRRILIEENDGQGALFEHFRYRLVLTNLPRSYSPRQVIDLTYQRCDQENVIEQFGQGIAGWRMPVAEFMGNSAWLQIARLAWNLGKWIAQIALPSEVVRWEWKRFRRHFVYIAAKVLKMGRQFGGAAGGIASVFARHPHRPCSAADLRDCEKIVKRQVRRISRRDSCVQNQPSTSAHHPLTLNRSPFAMETHSDEYLRIAKESPVCCWRVLSFAWRLFQD